MLGYVRIYKPELKIKDYEAYRGIYCSVCKTLGRQYGVFSRLLLSYDATFLAVVLLSVENVSPQFKSRRCPFNPAKKCSYCENADTVLSFAAAVTVLMFYYKIKDNIADGGFFKKMLMYLILPYAASRRKKAARKYPRLDSDIAGSIARQQETESSCTDSFDRAAHESADALGKIFTYFDADNRELYMFGYAVGRWVYLLDAADDIEKDIKSSSFNVFVNRYSAERLLEKKGEVMSEISATLNMSRAQAADAYEKMEAVVFLPVIENILFDGMGCSMNKILKGNINNEGPL